MTETRIESISPSESQAFDAASLFKLGLDSVRSDVEWLIEAVLTIQQSTLRQIDFYQLASDAVVETTALDEGFVVLFDSDQWTIVAGASRNGSMPMKFNQRVLERVIADRITCFEVVDSNAAMDNAEMHVYVASPLFDTSGEMIGVLFGSRKSAPKSECCGILRLEALLIQLVAGIINSGLNREYHRAEASRLQTQLEQFQSPKLVQAIKYDVGILEAREREITVLFSDIRGFTGLTERVGAKKAFTMVRNLMNQLTGCILDEEGFIMGYAGDGISAMWNGLTDQSDHAELACWAALNMQKVMSKLDQFWNFLTGEQLEARIGISTGIAHVGNVGSRWRLHFSALGPDVNLASRLEAANRFFGTSILIAESTRNKLFSRFSTRRIGPVIVQGTDQASNVYQLLGDSDFAVPKFIQEYETALCLFEAGDYAAAHQYVVSSIEQNGCIDVAAAELRSQIESHMSNSSIDKPAIRLTKK